MPYSYYPGCALHATSTAYDKSVRAVFSALGEQLEEVDDWNCCGATMYMSYKETVALAISARNLALAEKQGNDLVVPCSACFTVLSKTRRFMDEMPQLREDVGKALAVADLHPDYSVEVRHPLEVLINDIGIERIGIECERSLSGISAACYYGCQIVRPERATGDDPELPTALDRLCEAAGANTVDFPTKTRCCGGMLNTTFEQVALDLVEEILTWTTDAGANVVVTVCPLCQFNLEMYQKKLVGRDGLRREIPVLFFTQLVGLALGCSREDLGLDQMVVPLPSELVEA